MESVPLLRLTLSESFTTYSARLNQQDHTDDADTESTELQEREPDEDVSSQRPLMPRAGGMTQQHQHPDYNRVANPADISNSSSALVQRSNNSHHNPIPITGVAIVDPNLVNGNSSVVSRRAHFTCTTTTTTGPGGGQIINVTPRRNSLNRSSQPLSIQIFMGDPTLHSAAMPHHPLNSNNPRHLCCRFHAASLAKIIAYVEVVFSLVFLITIIVVGTTAFDVPAVGMIIGGLSNTAFGVTVAIFVLVGLRNRSANWLIPYLVVKGFQIGAIGIALVISFLGLLGFTALFGLVAATSGDPDYSPPAIYDSPRLIETSFSILTNDTAHISDDGGADPDRGSAEAGQRAVNRVTVIFALLLIMLMLVLGFVIYFFIVVFKTYRYLKEVHFYTGSHPNATGGGGGGPIVAYTPVPGVTTGPTIVIHGPSSAPASSVGCACPNDDCNCPHGEPPPYDNWDEDEKAL